MTRPDNAPTTASTTESIPPKENDNGSEVTTNTDNTTKKKVVLLRMDISSDNPAGSNMARTHWKTLSEMKKHFQIDILNSNQQEIELPSYSNSCEWFKENFQWSTRNQRNRQVFLITQYIRTPVLINEMKQNFDFKSKLDKHRVYLNVHKWDITVLDVRNIAFVRNIHPNHKNDNVSKSEILRYMAKKNVNFPFQLIPK